MLTDYKGDVTIKIDEISASAASVIVMTETRVLMSFIIHNPVTVTIGNTNEMNKSISMLDEIRKSIINAYVLKTNLPRAKISDVWKNAG